MKILAIGLVMIVAMSMKVLNVKLVLMVLMLSIFVIIVRGEYNSEHRNLVM